MNRFVQHFESFLLSDKYAIGSTLPSEKDVARELNIDIQEVHKGIAELTARGLITMLPDIGWVVNDYRKYGSFNVLSMLYNYENGNINPDILGDILEIRRLLETRTARLAARNRTEGHVKQFEQILLQDKTMHRENVPGMVELDFNFHHLISLASGNSIYPILLNSFKSIYTRLVAVFYTNDNVFNFHYILAGNIIQKDEERAVEVMNKILTHGEDFLYMALGKG